MTRMLDPPSGERMTNLERLTSSGSLYPMAVRNI